ncbi:MAG: TolC family protein [Cytophagales bacterium]|nr:TolC family protein [Cytophagales bacterium]
MFLILAGTLSLRAAPGPAADTIRLSLPDVETRFTSRNLLLLAGKYNIEAHKAYALQASLRDNPSLYLEQSAYNRNTGEYLPAQGPNGQNIVQIQQLFHLAGQRNKRISLERINTERAEFEFYDLLRALRYEARSAFFGLYFTQQSLGVYNAAIGNLRRTVELYQVQFDRGNVPLKELTRLKAFLFSLENEHRQLLNQITAYQSQLRILMSEEGIAYYVPEVDAAGLEAVSTERLSLDELLSTALNGRYDLKASEAASRLENQNLAYQKSLSVPDVRLGGVYDRNGSYISNYVGVSMGIDLPLFNRNQGNIKAARARTAESGHQADNFKIRVQQEVNEAFVKSQVADSLFRRYDRRSLADFDRLMDGMSRSYEKKNITLVEFIDFYESYKNQVLQMNQLQTERMQAFEELYYHTGKTWFNY